MAKPYQEVWVKGKSVSKVYQRPCEDRYKVIRHFAGRFERPFSVFDLGANLGYMSLRIAEDFPQATCVMADSKKQLPDICRKNDFSGVWLDRHFRGSELKRLALCEHFDVVLCLAVLHHFTHDWQEAIDAVMGLGDLVFIETPSPEDTGAKNPQLHQEILNYLNRFPYEVVAKFPSHVTKAERPVMLFRRPLSGFLTRQTIDAEERGAPRCRVTVDSDFRESTCRITHATGAEVRDYIPGMNLWNFKKLNGSWPTGIKPMVKRACEGLTHDDLQPWNFILNREGVTAIDYDNKPKIRPGRTLEKCLKML